MFHGTDVRLNKLKNPTVDEPSLPARVLFKYATMQGSGVFHQFQNAAIIEAACASLNVTPPLRPSQGDSPFGSFLLIGFPFTYAYVE